MTNIALETYMKEQLMHVSLKYKRYKYTQMQWDLRLLSLSGPKGVGKTTMVLQHILENPEEKSLYVSADHSYFTTHTLIELADEFVKDGGEHLYIDEVHKYDHWSREIKQIYDTHPGLKLLITSSSVLDLLHGEVDLSRRAVMTHMYGLSLREYMLFEHDIHVDTYTFDEILQGKAHLGDIEHPLPYFREFLHHGYYPFYKEGAFQTRLEQIAYQTVEVDIAHYAHISLSTARKLRKMLSIISANVPYKPEATALATELGVSRNDIPDLLLYLEKAGMICQLRDDTGGMRGLGKVEKVFLENTNLLYALAGQNAEIGNIRETAFYQMTRVTHDVIASRKSDFVVEGCTFEVGGKKKGKKQIKDISDGFVVRDEIEFTTSNIIPLWMFGLMY